jgi:transmembrane sensor
MADDSPGIERARHEAAEWFARLTSRTVAAADLHAFRAWRQAPENAAAYQEVEAVWKASGKLAHDPDIRAALAEALARRQPKLSFDFSGLRESPRLRTWLLAGLAGAALILAGLYVQDGRQTYVAGIGEQRLITLDDGSRLRLDAATRLRVRYSGQTRQVDLDRGRAFFEVAHDGERPFVVRAGDLQVRALGTRFDVARQERGARVTLVDGRVQVVRGASAWTLAPDQQLAVTPRSAPRPRSVDAHEATSWTEGRLTFEATPLAEALAEVNRYSRHTVRLEAAADLAATPISGVFDSGDTEAFVAAVADLYGLQAERRGGDWVLRPAPPRSAS